MEKFNYGLIAVDLNERKEIIDIIQFVGYWESPTEKDVELLREEFRDDPELCLQDRWNTIEIMEAPEEIVNEYQDLIFQCDEDERD